jgi:hypothetical protein
MRKVIRIESERAAMVGVILRTDLSKPYVLEWKRLAHKRSIQANGLYWMWLSCIAEETGHTKEELHEYFAQKNLPSIEKNVFGWPVTLRRSTATLDVDEFSTYLNKIEQEATELGIYLPKPGLPGWDDFYERYRL